MSSFTHVVFCHRLWLLRYVVLYTCGLSVIDYDWCITLFFTYVTLWPFCYRLWLWDVKAYHAVLYTCVFSVTDYEMCRPIMRFFTHVSFLLQIKRCVSCGSLHMCPFCYRIWVVYHAVLYTCVFSVTEFELCIMRFFAHVSSLLQIKRCVSCGSLHMCPFCYRLWPVCHVFLYTCIHSVTDYDPCVTFNCIHGTCHVVEDDVMCICEDGYRGDDCNGECTTLTSNFTLDH